MKADDSEEALLDNLTQMVARIYSTPEGAAGCCLHIITDDGNTEDDHVEWCIGHAMRQRHKECVRVACALYVTPEATRERLYTERYRAYSHR